jgi:hypothetical protein
MKKILFTLIFSLFFPFSVSAFSGVCGTSHYTQSIPSSNNCGTGALEILGVYDFTPFNHAVLDFGGVGGVVTAEVRDLNTDFLYGTIIFSGTANSSNAIDFPAISPSADFYFNVFSDGTASFWQSSAGQPNMTISFIPPANSLIFNPLVSSTSGAVLGSQIASAVGGAWNIALLAVSIPLSLWIIYEIMFWFPTQKEQWRVRGGVNLVREKETLRDLRK